MALNTPKKATVVLANGLGGLGGERYQIAG
jgi:hypothetical protein